jgi:hypothetical protein
MAITNWRGENTWAGCVLSVNHYSEHVPSDNAMIDSGNRTSAEVFDCDRMVVRTIHCGGGRGDEANVVVDASDEVRQAAEAYLNAVRWLDANVSEAYHIEKAAEQFNKDGTKIKAGDMVDVFKGRKVKKGVYTVRSVGDGQYGPYANLKGNGPTDFFSYVSLYNMRKVGFEEVKPDYSTLGEYAGFFIELGNSGTKMTALAIFCDKLDEENDERGIHLRRLSNDPAFSKWGGFELGEVHDWMTRKVVA